jgi:hypothetical protein
MIKPIDTATSRRIIRKNGRLRKQFSYLRGNHGMEFDDIARLWRQHDLSVRASNVLAKARIADEAMLLERFSCSEDVLRLRNCGHLTAHEIWQYIEQVSPEHPDQVVAALHRCHDIFHEVVPFEWSVKKTEPLLDLANLTFEDLIPR